MADRDPYRENQHPWGGTVIESKLKDPVYPEVCARRLGALHLDMANAAVVDFFDQLYNEIRRSANRVLELEKEIFMSNFNEVLDYYLVNNLTISYFEGSIYLLLTEHLCYQNSDLADQIVSYFDNKKEKYKVTRENTEVEKRKAIIELFQEDYRRSNYIRLIESHLDLYPYLNIDPSIFEDIDRIKDTRGSLVHNIIYLFQSENLEGAKIQMEECADCVKKMNRTLHNELIIHDGILSTIKR